MNDPGITSEDREQIRRYLERPGYLRTYEDLIPEDEPRSDE